MNVVLLRSNPVMPDPPVEKMASALVKLGHHVVILAWDRDDSYHERNAKKTLSSGLVDIVHFGVKAQYGSGMKNLRSLALFQLKLMSWLFAHHREYDVIHAFDFDTGLSALLASRVFRKKLVYHLLDYYIDSHGLAEKRLGSVVEKMEIGVINRADVAIICTEKRTEQIKKASPKRLYVIHNTPISAEVNVDAQPLQSEKKCTRVAYVGILGRNRALKETVSAISDMDDTELHIGGFGELEEYIESVAAENDNIYFYGKIPYEKTLSLEKKCDILVAIYDPAVPNHKYSAPNKFYESLMLGKPIIMAKHTGYDDIILMNRIGVLAEYSKDGVRDALNQLIAQKDNWEDMGRVSQQLYDELYSWEIMEQRICEIYSTL